MSYDETDAAAMAGWIVIGTCIGALCALIASIARHWRITRR